MLTIMFTFGIFLLCLVLLVQSFGAVHVGKPPFPMMQGMGAHAGSDSSSTDRSASDDCCEADETVYRAAGGTG